MRISLCVAICCVLGVTTQVVEARAASPDQSPVPARPIPGLTAVDTHPEGCVSCHIVMNDIGVDARLSTALGKWESGVPAKIMAIARRATNPDVKLLGRHPSVPLPLEDIPDTCIRCHQAVQAAPRFVRLVHLVHYSGGDENHFLTLFGGECTLCHKMDTETGAWRMPSGPEK